MGASSFFTKPVSIDALLRDIKDKLKERERKKLIAGKKVEEWVKLRISKIQLSEYSRFAEEAADLFNIFGLSRTQAKVYTALNALGVATASEISALSKIRREEVYRVMPDLESRGMIICKLDAPRKFAATEPKTALNILVNSKVDSMEREINNLKQKKDDLIARLENTSFGIYEENSVEALSRQDNIDMRLSQMTKKAKNSIAMVGSLEEMKKIIHEASEAGDSQIKMRTVVDSSDIQDLDGESGGKASLRRFLQVACKGNCTLDLRQVNKQSFNLVVVDSKEAIWGEPTSKKSEGKVFWTNDPTQVCILRRAFENLWQEALPCESLENGVKESTLM
jgi:sugar-specific transcriptional regulator TrmB